MSWQCKEKIALVFTPTVGTVYNLQFVTGSECVVEKSGVASLQERESLERFFL